MRALGIAILVAAVVMPGCATRTQTQAAPAARDVLTVPHLQDELERGEAEGILLAEIERSGTVYRLTTQQRSDLRASGMPASLLGLMQNTYERAVRARPELATSDEHWKKIGDYWYGGPPAGWPPDWLTKTR
jgi:hypothetical protein